MRRLIYTPIFIAIAFVFTVSCEDHLDVSPNLGISQEEVFSDYFSVRSMVDRAYRLINNPKYNHNDWEGEFGVKSDEAQAAKLNNPMASTFNSGNWFNQNWRDLGGMSFLTRNQEFNDNRDRFANVTDKGMWGIRAVNIVLENIEQLEEYPTELGFTQQELKDQLIGQAYFLRAFHYFQIIRRYGGFPILDKVLGSDTEFDVVRPTYLESTDFMIEDLDKAIALLPEKWTGVNYGRATKSSARALKTMGLLYAASPLMNPQLNPYGSDSKIYNQEYAAAAAAAAVETINGLAAGGYYMHSWDDYTENWHSRSNVFSPESLVVSPHSPFTKPVTTNRYGKGWFLAQSMGGWGAQGNPTQNAVDWFETSTGYDINDPEAQSAGGYNTNNPYENRDPRLKRLIWTHGADMFEGLTRKPGAARQKMDAKVGGFHYNFDTSRRSVFTGFYHRGKHSWPGNDNWNRSVGWFTYMPYIRVSQVYLDLAEAANVAYGPNGAIPGSSLTAVSALNVVRNRANMPNVLSKYTTDTDTFMKRVINERAVELYHEEHRWYDLRRWKLAKEVLGGGSIYGADIQVVNGNLVYGKKVLDGASRTFEDKHYWYPFPSEVINNFSNFAQNPGW